ncbi:DUF4352 domain-containing protein [Mammaliicoccus vitulinus]|uniref:DUF4352 domain-containing protein n=1 Tax=Mammaliicoccus vitulinus TaxID=71237 RepID=A0ABX7HGR8_9STAP|nr:DUF4352 domain-containing protein [Mammaliicoccus vitulinus]PNZ35443.1 hypothetical protein CD107_11105 [Mammaliicoccus vitulinus]QRO85437.1 DUF4352 domain-containing protein [Mammaliicoccus vitulinus]
MSSILFALLWVIISIAFITTLVITVVKYAKEKQYSSYLVSTILLFVIGVISFVFIFVSLSFDKEYSYDQLFKEDKPKQVKHISDTPKKDLKDLKIGDKIIVDGLEVTVTKAEFVLPDDGYSYSQNGKILKINYKFKNLEKDKKFIDNSNFKLTIDGEVQPQFNGMKDNKGGFQHQLDKGKSGSSYLYYDVVDTDKYQVEMDIKPSKKTYKANWNIAKKDIKEDLNSGRTSEEAPPQEPQTYEQNTVQQPNNSAEEQRKLDEAEKKRQQDAKDKAAKEEADKKSAEDEKAHQEEADKKAEDEQAAKDKAAEDKAAEDEKQQAAEDKAAEEQAAKDKAAEQQKAKQEQEAEQNRREEQAAAEREKQQQQQQEQAAQREKERAAQQAAQKERDRAAEPKQSQRDSNSSEER